MIGAHPAGRRAAGGPDHVRRRARGRPARRGGRPDRADGGARACSAGTTWMWRCSRPRAAASCCAAWATSRTTRRSSPTSAPTTWTSTASTRCRRSRRSRRSSRGSRRRAVRSCSTRRTIWSRASRGRSRAPVWWFSMDPGHPRVRRIGRTGRASGRGRSCCATRPSWSWTADGAHPLVAVADVPATLGGVARHNVANALAAAAGARAMGATRAEVAAGLRGFRTTADQAPGRLNLYTDGRRTVIVDFAHNEAGLAVALDTARGLARRIAADAPVAVGHRHRGRSTRRYAARRRPRRRPARGCRAPSRSRCTTSAVARARMSSGSSAPGLARGRRERQRPCPSIPTR